MRIVIELKRDANPQVVLNKLYMQTALQSNFSIIMLALVNDQSQPKVLTLRQVLDEYIAFQEDIILRRTRFDLKKALERAHLLEGLIIAQDNIDEVIRIIRESYDDAREKLMARFGLDEVQAQAILDMRLKQLQGLDREKLEAEYKELEERIAYYASLLADREKMQGVLKDELLEIREKYGNDRKTAIEHVEDEIDIEDLIEEEECVFTLSNAGYLKRTPASAYRTQKRGGKGVNAMTTREEDFVSTLFTCSTHDYILFCTSRGQVHRKKGYQIPEAGRTAKGVNIINLIPIEQGEKVTAMLHIREFAENEYLVFATRNGTVKRITLSSINTARKAGIRALNLAEGDELMGVWRTDGEQDVFLATHEGMCIRFHEQDVRCMGRDAVGVRGIHLRGGDFVIGGGITGQGDSLLSITERGFGKRTLLEEYSVQGRGGFGNKNYNITDKTGPVAASAIVEEAADALMISDDGTIIRTAVSGINLYGRVTQGVHIMTVADGVKVISMATVLDSAETEEENSDIGAEPKSGESSAVGLDSAETEEENPDIGAEPESVESSAVGLDSADTEEENPDIGAEPESGKSSAVGLDSADTEEENPDIGAEPESGKSSAVGLDSADTEEENPDIGAEPESGESSAVGLDSADTGEKNPDEGTEYSTAVDKNAENGEESR